MASVPMRYMAVQALQRVPREEVDENVVELVRFTACQLYFGRSVKTHL